MRWARWSGLTNSRQGLTGPYRYDPYGTPTHTYCASLNGALFAGQAWDFNNFYYMRTRYYMPSIGRFLSHDPAGGEINPYLYAGDDPVDFSDPTGAYPAELPCPCGQGQLFPTPHFWGVPAITPPRIAQGAGLGNDVPSGYRGQNGGGPGYPGSDDRTLPGAFHRGGSFCRSFS